MTVAVPDRYLLQVRLGQQDHVEEWLASDTVLDRPVMVRALGPEAPRERIASFLEDVRVIAAVSHPHLAEIYEAGTSDAATWAIAEWVGGVTLEDRAAAGAPIPPDEFLPNAGGLAEALATLHDRGLIHGAIDERSVAFAAAHPAKLIAYTRTHEGASQDQDVRDLAAVLTFALTGQRSGAGPSQLSDLIDPSVDEALAQARQGSLTARELAAKLHAAPTRVQVGAPVPRGRRWLVVAAVLVLAAILLAAFADLQLTEDQPPFAIAGSTLASSTTGPPTTNAPTTVTTTPAPIRVQVIDVLDPSADGERDDDLPLMIDDDPATGWRTERYFAPIQALKPGVGVTMVLSGSPTRIEILGSPETEYELRWAPTIPDELSDWEVLAEGVLGPEPVVQAVPSRRGGFWLVWITGLTPQGQSEDDPPRDFFYSFLYEVRFAA
jgi:hypothetical protein